MFKSTVVVLHDLTKVHTALVDRHLTALGLALGDACALVRQQALLLIAQLVLEDYVKWRPPLLRCFVTVLVDPEPSLRLAAHGCLFELLLPRAPLLGFNSFLGLLFALNGCTHAPHHPRPLPEPERKVVEMAGEGKQRRRLQILRLLLQHMSDEQKLQITGKLCHDVLAAVPDGTLPLESARAVLADALMLLACKEIKLGTVASADDDSAELGTDAEGGTEAEAVKAKEAAKSKLLTQVARKAMVESIVPIVIELKRHLENDRSPLLRDVFIFLRELLRDHKAHLQDIFARDRQLATEVEYDMRQLKTTAPPSVLQPLSPLAFTPSSTRRPGSRSRTSPTRCAVQGAPEVPTPDRLKPFAVPKLAKGRSATSSLPHGSGGRNSGNTGASCQLVRSLAVRSPDRVSPPLRQWLSSSSSVAAEGGVVVADPHFEDVEDEL